MGIRNRVKSALRLPKTGKLITYKGYTRPYRRNIYGKLYLYFPLIASESRQRTEKSASRRFKDFIIVPYWKGKKKLWGIYVEADEYIRYVKRRKT
jgi:hypothetical protein